jgi:hypothetical protein
MLQLPYAAYDVRSIAGDAQPPDQRAAALQRWYGTPIPSLTSEQRTLAAALVDVARGDAGVRALTAWSMGWSAAQSASASDWLAPLLIELLDDDYAAIRYVAYHSLLRINGFADLQYDYVAGGEARWAAQREARERWARAPHAAVPAGVAPLFERDGRFLRGELERLIAERPEDDEMFLAE